MTTHPNASLYRKYPHMCKFLGTIPSDQLQYAKVPFWDNIQIPLSKHTWELKIIAIWHTKGRVCLNAHNKDWLKELAKEIPEAKWEIQNIRSHPYQTWPILLPKSFGTYQTKVTPFMHTCIFSINWEMPKLKRTTMRTTRPS